MESLRKKSNRSRINRLERLGAVELVQLHSRADLESMIERIATFCDLRQGAINATLPFRDDPFKREFMLRLADACDLTHCTALLVGAEPAALHLGFRNDKDVVLGLIAHSPFLARHSPGKLVNISPGAIV